MRICQTGPPSKLKTTSTPRHTRGKYYFIFARVRSLHREPRSDTLLKGFECEELWQLGLRGTPAERSTSHTSRDRARLKTCCDDASRHEDVTIFRISDSEPTSRSPWLSTTGFLFNPSLPSTAELTLSLSLCMNHGSLLSRHCKIM